MGKNKKSGGLIEDRVIRNPMDQMRRKLKLKEKEKKRDQRDTFKQQQYEQLEQRGHIDPLRAHDFQMINQLKSDQARHAMGLKPQPFTAASVTGKNQINTIDMGGSVVEVPTNNNTTWQEIQQNYFRQMQGMDVQEEVEQ